MTAAVTEHPTPGEISRPKNEVEEKTLPKYKRVADQILLALKELNEQQKLKAETNSSSVLAVFICPTYHCIMTKRSGVKGFV